MNNFEFGENTVRGDVDNYVYIQNAILTSYIINNELYKLFALNMNGENMLVLYELDKHVLVKKSDDSYAFYSKALIEFIRENNKGKVKLLHVLDEELKKEMISALNAYKLIHNTQ